MPCAQASDNVDRVLPFHDSIEFIQGKNIRQRLLVDLGSRRIVHCPCFTLPEIQMTP
jgi:hypothetical protein